MPAPAAALRAGELRWAEGLSSATPLRAVDGPPPPPGGAGPTWREGARRGPVAGAVSHHPPPAPSQSATPRPSAPAGQYSPDGRWYWNGEQWIPVTIPGPAWARPYAPAEGRAAAAVA